ncbi:hypothetical protein N431DRAFT_443880 [Stipitochalara longipes BDJ]|nr:hypothetical protein N431DRAFT_443880 [Stipitochalara longipes BDJ]
MDKGSSNGGGRQIPTAGDADEDVWRELEWSGPRKSQTQLDNSASKLRTYHGLKRCRSQDFAAVLAININGNSWSPAKTALLSRGSGLRDASRLAILMLVSLVSCTPPSCPMPLTDSLTERDLSQAMLCIVQLWRTSLGYPTAVEGDDTPCLELFD